RFRLQDLHRGPRGSLILNSGKGALLRVQGEAWTPPRAAPQRRNCLPHQSVDKPQLTDVPQDWPDARACPWRQCASRMGEETMQGADATSSAPPPRGPNRRAAPDRQIRELRARPSPGGVKPEFEYELLAMFINNELSARITLPLLALIFSLASMFW